MVFIDILMEMGWMFMGLGIVAYLDTHEVKDRDTEMGTVMVAWVKEENSSGSGNTPSHHDHFPKVEYTYQVNGATYFGGQLDKIESGYSSYVDAQNCYDRYAVGTQVTVYYNPDETNEAVLEQNSETEALMFPGIGALFLVMERWASSISSRSGGLETDRT
jgi:hypothetical protein